MIQINLLFVELNEYIYHNYCCSGYPSTSTLTYSAGAYQICSLFNATANVNLSIPSYSWFIKIHLELINKLPNTILSPIFTPGILDQPTVFTISNIPTNNFDSMTGTEFLIAGQYLIYSFFIDKEISIYRDYSNNWTIVYYLLFYILFLFSDTIIGNFEFLAIFCSFLALLGSIRV